MAGLFVCGLTGAFCSQDKQKQHLENQVLLYVLDCGGVYMLLKIWNPL